MRFSYLQANGIDLTQATHHQARTALTSVGGGGAVARSFELTVYRERASASECGGGGGSSGSGCSGRRHFGSNPDNPFEREGKFIQFFRHFVISIRYR